MIYTFTVNLQKSNFQIFYFNLVFDLFSVLFLLTKLQTLLCPNKRSAKRSIQEDLDGFL